MWAFWAADCVRSYCRETVQVPLEEAEAAVVAEVPVFPDAARSPAYGSAGSFRRAEECNGYTNYVTCLGNQIHPFDLGQK